MSVFDIHGDRTRSQLGRAQIRDAEFIICISKLPFLHQHLSHRVAQRCTTTETQECNSMSQTQKLAVLKALRNYENDENFKRPGVARNVYRPAPCYVEDP